MRVRRLLLCLAPPALLLALLAPLETGRVTDPDGKPLADAIVRCQATRHVTRTDAAGRFLRPGSGHLTAAKPGYLIAGGGLDLVLRPLAPDNPDYHWVDPGPERGQPGNCASCHRELQREWSASGHARAATGRHFRSLYEGTNWTGTAPASWGVRTQNDLGVGVCVSCHAPAVRDEEPGALDLRDLTGTARQGVHCDYCHKVEGLSGPITGLNHGRFVLQLRRPPPDEQLFFGPLDDVDRGEDAFAPFQRDSRFCAACHEGTVFGVPVYTTYSEWLATRSSRSCQSCHLRPTGQLTNVAPGRGGRARDPLTLANHRFFAGSHDEMLRDSVALTGTAERDTTGVTVRAVLLARNVGHRVPTGYIDRHLILVASARDERGQPSASSTGPRLPSPAGTLAGQPGRLFGRLLTDPEGHQPAPFWRARTEVVDTRLYPDQAEATTWRFPPATQTVQLRLLYRRFWEEVAVAKGWPPVETVVRERTLVVPPARVP